MNWNDRAECTGWKKQPHAYLELSEEAGQEQINAQLGISAAMRLMPL